MSGRVHTFIDYPHPDLEPPLMITNAKVRVESITKPVGLKDYRDFIFVPVYSSDPTSENYSWSKWTPTGRIHLGVTNTEAFKDAKVGDEFLLSFTPVEA